MDDGDVLGSDELLDVTSFNLERQPVRFSLDVYAFDLLQVENVIEANAGVGFFLAIIPGFLPLSSEDNARC